jgi:hypothetical protein
MGRLHLTLPTAPFEDFYFGHSNVHYGECVFWRRAEGYCLSKKTKSGGGSVPKECTLLQRGVLEFLRIRSCPLPATPPSAAQKDFKSTHTSACNFQNMTVLLD